MVVSGATETVLLTACQESGGRLCAGVSLLLQPQLRFRSYLAAFFPGSPVLNRPWLSLDCDYIIVYLPVDLCKLYLSVDLRFVVKWEEIQAAERSLHMAKKTEAQKKAQRAYIDKFARVEIRMEIEQRDKNKGPRRK